MTDNKKLSRSGLFDTELVSDEALASAFDPKVYQWAYTLAVAPYRKVHGKRYKDHMEAAQKHLLCAGVADACSVLDLEPFDMVYENTQKQNVHIHGKFFADTINAQLFQINLSIMFGYPNNDKQRVCFIKRCFVNPQNNPVYRDWYDYLTKDTPLGRYGGLNYNQLNTNMFL